MALYGAIVLVVIFSFYLGVVFYIQAVLADIKSLFNRTEKILKSKDAGAETGILGYCIEAIDLHARAQRQIMTELISSPTQSNIRIIFNFIHLINSVARISWSM